MNEDEWNIVWNDQMQTIQTNWQKRLTERTGQRDAWKRNAKDVCAPLTVVANKNDPNEQM